MCTNSSLVTLLRFSGLSNNIYHPGLFFKSNKPAFFLLLINYCKLKKKERRLLL